jgi:hypothetical protein
MSALHSILPLPRGKKIADLLSAFSGIKGEIRIGQPNQECACCRRPFTTARKPRKVIRLVPADVAHHLPVVVELRICGACMALYQRGGMDRERYFVAVQAYVDGLETSQ